MTKLIAARARGFVYCVSVTGVTGERGNITKVAELKRDLAGPEVNCHAVL